MKEERDALMMAYRSDGQLTKRPLSPHLQVYRPQITSVLSIMNRVTGIASTVGTVMFVWWLADAAAGPVAFGHVQWFLSSWLGLFMLFGWTASLFYHFFGGLRHLAWDSGYGFSLPATYRSGVAAIVATVVMTVLVWVAGLLVLRS